MISESRIIRIKHNRTRERDLTVKAIKVERNATNVKDRPVLGESLHENLIGGVPRQVTWKRAKGATPRQFLSTESSSEALWHSKLTDVNLGHC